MKDFLGNLKFAWKYAKNNKKNLIWYIIVNILIIIISVIVPVLSAKIIIYLTDNEFYQLLLIALIIMLVEWFRNFMHYFRRHNSNILFRETYVNLQTNLGKEILKIENKYIDSTGSGLFIQRLTNDTSKLSEIFPLLGDFLTNIITYIGIFVAIFVINKIVFVYMVLSIIIIYFVERKRVKLRNENDKKFRKMNEKVSSFVGEMVRGIRDIKMLNSEESFSNELKRKVINLNFERYEMNRVDRNYSLYSGTLLDLNDFLLIVLLVLLIKNKDITIASALVIHNYSSRLSDVVYWVGSLLEKVKDFNLSVDRIKEIMNSEKFTKETFGTKHIDKVHGDFEFKNVTFAYDEKNILDKASFKIEANSTVAFVGKSGAGKTTIFSLLCKLYNIDSGEITIDGININKLDKDSIRGNITIINQNPYIFNVSIKDNLRLVKEDITEEEMIEACKMACLDDFINTLPEKYDTIVGEGGVNLSGGQKQRLAIARALVQKTEIILFDEATSALDNETQERIQEAINNMQGEYTILIIAHRLSTIINADRILFLDDGKIKAEGTHEYLLKNYVEYKKLYETEIKNRK
ncbi:MAG: ABC transporter ATP-binding protein [Bacilli bacterium]